MAEIITSGKVQYFQFGSISRIPGIFHCISTRNTGISKGEYTSLNLGYATGDSENNVAENRRRFFNALNISEGNVAKPGQIHSGTVVNVNAAGTYHDCDGLITGKKGVALSIQTADCMPLFLISTAPACIGLIHAGWRGIEKDIVQQAVSVMMQYFGVKPSGICAVIGPGIRKCCYEIKEDVACYFSDNYLIGNHLDLVTCIADSLIEKGIDPENIEDCNLCTSCSTSYFYSYRKSKGVTGRMMSIIMIE